MGTHPKSPSRLLTTDATLSSYLASRPDLIGKAVLEKFKDEGAEPGNLPFLFKVLSVEKALSIQTHPDKKTAEALHQSQPDIYRGK
jgi:mannose-6-phosphate isomerase